MLDRFPSRGERHAGGDDPTPCADPKGTEVRTVHPWFRVPS
jgi:hypothetical protein